MNVSYLNGQILNMPGYNAAFLSAYFKKGTCEGIFNWSNIIQYLIRKVPSLEDSYLEGFLKKNELIFWPQRVWFT